MEDEDYRRAEGRDREEGKVRGMFVRGIVNFEW
jgi:hypothetical protein